jgi:hypothetical protein
MNRQEILAQITQVMGGVPGWLDGLPDAQLEPSWAQLMWFFTDTKLSARDKALAAFGAATASHCAY